MTKSSNQQNQSQMALNFIQKKEPKESLLQIKKILRGIILIDELKH